MKLANNMTFENLIQSYEEMYDCKYDNLQLKELRYGFKQGLDISVFSNPKFAFNQMDEIRQGLAENLNVSIYAKPTFDVGQMRQIKKGLERNVDVSQYLDVASLNEASSSDLYDVVRELDLIKCMTDEEEYEWSHY